MCEQLGRFGSYILNNLNLTMSSLIGIQEESLVGSLLLACTSNGKDVLSKAAGFPETI